MPENLKDLISLIAEGKQPSTIEMPSEVLPEVVENGERVANPRMDPGIMQFVMLSSIASQAIKIRKYFDDRTSMGGIQTFNLTVTDVRQRIDITYPAQAMSIINDGADEVFVWINTIGRPRHEILAGETFNIDFETHKINELYFQCNSGETTTIRIVAND